MVRPYHLATTTSQGRCHVHTAFPTAHDEDRVLISIDIGLCIGFRNGSEEFVQFGWIGEVGRVVHGDGRILEQGWYTRFAEVLNLRCERCQEVPICVSLTPTASKTRLKDLISSWSSCPSVASHPRLLALGDKETTSVFVLAE